MAKLQSAIFLAILNINNENAVETLKTSEIKGVKLAEIVDYYTLFGHTLD